MTKYITNVRNVIWFWLCTYNYDGWLRFWLWSRVPDRNEV